MVVVGGGGQANCAGRRNNGPNLPERLSSVGSDGHQAHLPADARWLFGAPAVPRRAVWERDFAQCCGEYGAADLLVSEQRNSSTGA